MNTLFIFVLYYIGNCYSNELLAQNLTPEQFSNHSQINIFENESINNQIVARYIRQNAQVKSNPKVETPKSQQIQAPKDQNKTPETKKQVIQKMAPRTNSHRNSHSAQGRRANIALSLKQRTKTTTVKSRPKSRFYSKTKHLTTKKFSSSKIQSSQKSKSSGSMKKKYSNSKQFSKKYSSKGKQPTKTKFTWAKSKYFSKAKHSSRNVLSKSKLPTKRINSYIKGGKQNGLKSKYYSNKKQNSYSKLKKNVILKPKNNKKSIKNGFNRPNVVMCMRRSKRGIGSKRGIDCASTSGTAGLRKRPNVKDSTNKKPKYTNNNPVTKLSIEQKNERLRTSPIPAVQNILKRKRQGLSKI